MQKVATFAKCHSCKLPFFPPWDLSSASWMNPKRLLSKSQQEILVLHAGLSTLGKQWLTLEGSLIFEKVSESLPLMLSGLRFLFLKTGRNCACHPFVSQGCCRALWEVHLPTVLCSEGQAAGPLWPHNVFLVSSASGKGVSYQPLTSYW